MKNKNPLYVVKGQDVEAAENVFDLILKKFNLEPIINFLMQILKMLLDNVKSYQAFIVVKELFDDLMSRFELFKKFSIL